MKRLLLSTLAVLALTATAAVADGPSAGLSDPVVIAPAASSDWTGPYLGLNYAVDTNNLELNSEDVGGFAGYRYDLGTLVAGAEVGVNNDLNTLEAQAGLDLGVVLPYAFAGVADFADQDGTTYGVGADAAIGKNLLLGVKYTRGEFDAVDVESTTLRIGIKF